MDHQRLAQLEELVAAIVHKGLDVDEARTRFAAIARHLREEGQPNEELEDMLLHFDERTDRLLTTRVDVRDYLQVRDDALRAHATQVDPEGPFFRIPHEVDARSWGTDDYELHISRIGVRLPETDLFAGLRPQQPEPHHEAEGGWYDLVRTEGHESGEKRSASTREER